MEVYKKVGDNTFNAYDACNVLNALTTTGKEDLNQQVQIGGRAGVKVEENQLISLRALKATNGNVEK